MGKFSEWSLIRSAAILAREIGVPLDLNLDAEFPVIDIVKGKRKRRCQIRFEGNGIYHMTPERLRRIIGPMMD